MKVYTRFFALSMLFCLWLVSTAQAQLVEGHVVDQSTGQPLAGVNILVMDTDIGTSTPNITARRLPQVSKAG